MINPTQKGLVRKARAIRVSRRIPLDKAQKQIGVKMENPMMITNAYVIFVIFICQVHFIFHLPRNTLLAMSSSNEQPVFFVMPIDFHRDIKNSNHQLTHVLPFDIAHRHRVVCLRSALHTHNPLTLLIENLSRLNLL